MSPQSLFGLHIGSVAAGCRSKKLLKRDSMLAAHLASSCEEIQYLQLKVLSQARPNHS